MGRVEGRSSGKGCEREPQGGGRGGAHQPRAPPPRRGASSTAWRRAWRLGRRHQRSLGRRRLPQPRRPRLPRTPPQ
eukprot:9880577-Alexandrium_andersonii.AAC.1